MVLWLRNVATVGAILLGTLALEAQDAPDNSPPPPMVDRAKVLALLDAADIGARMKAILKERYEAACTELEGRWKEYYAGRGTLDDDLDVSRRLFDAECDVCTDKTDRVAVLRAYWQRLDAMHKLNEDRHERGRIPTKDLMRTLFERGGAEMELDRQGAWPGPPPRPPTQILKGWEDWRPYQFDVPAAPAETVRALLNRPKIGERRRAFLKTRIEAAFFELESRWGEYMAGRGTLDILLETSDRLLGAEFDLSDRRADRLVFLDAHRRRIVALEEATQARFDVGRVPEQDLRQTQYARLTAEIGLERAKSADTDKLKRRLKARAEAAEAEVVMRRIEYRNGRGTLDILLEANKHWLQAVQDMGDEPAHRVAALEAYRRRMAEIEKITQLRYDAQRLPIQDLAEVRYFRAEADLWLERAKAGR